jgi:hypothetical protein
LASPPLACDRTALTDEARRRHFAELGPALQARAKQVREIADGFEIEFPFDTETDRLLAEWAAGERRCCPFFEIAIYADPHSAGRWLRLRGRPGVKEFIRAEFAAWFAS